MIGQTLGHYQIVEKVGQGGMGVVYRAQDSHLHRSVALKFLPETFATDPERLVRFEHEAKLLASLNNPNIASIYGLEEVDSRRFIVQELVEGETLAQRIAKGPLPLDETLEICHQIAEGLEAAHEKGIIHRDLKPANIKITPEGKVKILDFGLAKVFHEEPAAADPSQSPTVTLMSRPGVILGTAAYMSPEQAKGKAVDKRTDIWAFGCVLYECLTGKMAFEGETVTETLAVILKGEPDWRSLPQDIPAGIRNVLTRCLQKDPKARIHDVTDAWLEIEAAPNLPSGDVAGRKRLSLLWMAAGAVALLFAGGLLDRLLTGSFLPASAAPVIRSIIKVQPGLWLDGMRRDLEGQRPTRIAMALSNDGRFVVYSAIAENPGAQAKPQLYLRRLDQLEAKPIAGTEGGIHPFLSPDDRWVGFWVNGYLNKIPIEGDTPATPICIATLPIYGASWHDNNIVFAAGFSAGLSRVSADGGEPELLTKPDPKREESSHRLPSWLPGGRAVLFTVTRHYIDTKPWVALLQLDSREWRLLLQDAADARYVPTGHLVFLRQGTLMAVRFDPDKLQTLGRPSSVAKDIIQALDGYNANYNSGVGQLGISKEGSLLYAAGGILPPQEHSLVWVDQQGNEQPAVPLKFPFFAPRLSPDGRHIAYGTTGKEWQIWVYDLGSGTNTRLTNEGMASYPIWTPDGKRLVFSWCKALAMNLFVQAFDGSSPVERLTTGEIHQNPGSWLRNSDAIALVESRPDTGSDIAVFESRSGRVSPFLNSNYSETYPEISPDGRWIAYSSNESKRSEVYIRPFPGPGGKWQISVSGGMQPLWSKNGKQLFYRWRDQVWIVDVQLDGGLVIGNRRMLFEKPGYTVGGPIRSYELSLDGQRFLMVKMDTRKPTPVTEMILVQNWFEELKRLVPTGNK